MPNVIRVGRRERHENASGIVMGCLLYTSPHEDDKVFINLLSLVFLPELG